MRKLTQTNETECAFVKTERMNVFYWQRCTQGHKDVPASFSTITMAILERLLPGANHAWKVEGTKVWVPTPGRVRPAPGQRLGWAGCWVRKGVAPSRCENSDAKSCILVTTCCEFFLLFENYGKEVGEANTLLVPNLKVGDQSPPVSAVVASMIVTLIVPNEMLMNNRQYTYSTAWWHKNCHSHCTSQSRDCGKVICSSKLPLVLAVGRSTKPVVLNFHRGGPMFLFSSSYFYRDMFY